GHVRRCELVGADVRCGAARLVVVVDGHGGDRDAGVVDGGGRRRALVDVEIGGSNEDRIGRDRGAVLAGRRLPRGQGRAVGGEEADEGIGARGEVVVVVDVRVSRGRRRRVDAVAIVGGRGGVVVPVRP